MKPRNLLPEMRPSSADKRPIVQRTTDALRQRIMANPVGAYLGSLPVLAQQFHVGIVTIQQAARVLEYEGLLEVRRGPRGGYYGRRPDMADIEHMLGVYLCAEPGSWREILDIISLLFNRLCAAAARCEQEELHQELKQVRGRIAACEQAQHMGALESALQDILLKMVKQPLLELLTRVALGTAPIIERGEMLERTFPLDIWRDGRLHIIDAIAAKDPALAHFEADRHNRQILADLYHFEKI